MTAMQAGRRLRGVGLGTGLTHLMRQFESCVFRRPPGHVPPRGIVARASRSDDRLARGSSRASLADRRHPTVNSCEGGPMRSTRLIPVAVLAFAVACSDTATSPTPVGGPLFSVSPGSFGNVTTLNAAGTPSGGHIQSGGPVFCLVDADLNVFCSGAGSYQINGIGNTNATATLSATYSATVDCTNRGGKLVPVKSQLTGAPATSGSLSPDNGHLTVPQISTSTPSAADFEAAATCPNGNWTKSLAPGDPTLESFEYDLTFAGFVTAAILISAS